MKIKDLIEEIQTKCLEKEILQPLLMKKRKIACEFETGYNTALNDLARILQLHGLTMESDFDFRIN
jgi:hypothetical protein